MKDKAKAIHGAQTVVDSWLEIHGCDRLLVVTDTCHAEEVQLLRQAAEKRGCECDISVNPDKSRFVGVYYDNNPEAFLGYDCIVGATDYSLVTTLAAKNAILRGGKFLSLPLHTNDGRSMLEYDFINCDIRRSKLLAQALISYLHDAHTIHLTTRLGTDMYFYKKDRHAKFFNGNVHDCGGYSSASVEVYVPIEETRTHGKLVLDGSYGYIGKVQNPVEILFSCGRIISIANTADGNILKEFIEGYNDEKMYTAGEFGIGLNPLSHCDGNCYIEDESALGTCHIGLGRNLALGGFWQACGHFDLTVLSPDVYADGVKIMHNGNIII